jgi:hypothetical protein
MFTADPVPELLAMNKIMLGLACAALTASLLPAKADTDACTLLTPAQVSAAVGFAVGQGTHVTPTFVKTCTWNGSGGGVQTVTLNLQAAAFFDGAKRQASMMAAAGAAVKPAGVGDDSFYLVEGTQVMLWVKKGGNAFKIAIYKQISPDQKEAMEQALAKQVAARL